MSKRLESMTDEELREEEAAILAYCEMWESTTDGSHGMALYNAGYNRVKQEIERRG